MGYNFSINDFEGPIDLLLHLVKTNEMDIYSFDTCEIINQYLKYIETLEDLNIDIASEYLVMASELLHLKSRLLLNMEIDEKESDEELSINSEEDLKNKLAMYEQYKNISQNFRELAEKRSEVYTKLPSSLQEYSEESKLVNTEITINDLVNALLNFKQREELNKPLNTKIARRELSVSERTKNIRDILKIRKKVSFLELFEVFNKEYIVVTLLSILEMTKNNEINIIQKQNFAEILIEGV